MTDSLQSNGSRLKTGLRTMEGPVATALHDRITATLAIHGAKQRARDAAFEALKPMRSDTTALVNKAKALVEGLVLNIAEVHNGRFALIADAVKQPDYDRIAFGCTLPGTYKDDTSVSLFANTVGAVCVSARDMLIDLAKQEAEAAKADVELEEARVDAQEAQTQATFAIKRTPRGSKAREAIKRTYSTPRKNKKHAGTSTGEATATTVSPATAPTPASAPKAA